MYRLLALFFISFCCMTGFAQKKYWLLAGTYTGSGSKGVYVYKFDPITGKADSVSILPTDNPSYLAITQKGNQVFTVTENGGENPGEISAFSFSNKQGTGILINKKSTGGDHPCFVAVNKSATWVAAANYTGGSLSVLKVNKDGSLQAAAQVVQHNGTGPVSSRQEKPHVHSVNFSPNEKYLIAADLGLDELVAYPFDAKKDKPLDEAGKIIIKTAAGSGPRHITFHNEKPLIYVMEELTGNISVYEFTNGQSLLVQTIACDTISPLPDRGSADIHFSPDGRFLYASNRGVANNIAIYSVQQSNGQLSLIGYQSVLGTGPRNFMIDPTGNYLLVTNQRSNNVVFFKRNTETGLLTDTGERLQINSPVCLKMTEVK